MALVKPTETFKGNDRSGPADMREQAAKVPQSVWDKKDAAMKLGGEMHDAAEITGALIMAHGLKTEDAIATFEKVLAGVIAAREKLEQ